MKGLQNKCNSYTIIELNFIKTELAMIYFYLFITANFGPWDLGPQHGFARIMSWNSTEVSKVRNT